MRVAGIPANVALPQSQMMELIAEYFEVAAARQSNYSDSPLDMRSHAEVGVDEDTEVTH